MIVTYAITAQEDLDAIRRWIARDDPNRAISFVRELQDRADDLVRGPQRFPLIDEDRLPGIRRRNHRGYRIIYCVTEAEITILHVHHGRRGAPAF